MRYYFETDFLPIPLNKKLRSHRWKLLNETRSWQAVIYSQLTEKPRRPIARAKITIIRSYYRMLDYDGLVGSLKPVVDALVKNGVIKDDGWPQVGRWDVDQQFRPKSEGALLQIWVEDQDVLDKAASISARFEKG